MIAQDLQQRIDAYRGNPQMLEQRFQQSQQLIDLLALQKIKSEKEAAARAMQMQMAQAQPQTVAQQREQEVMDMTRQEVAQRIGQVGQQQMSRQQDAMKKLLGGIAATPGAQTAMTPRAMAAGGIVAFQEGGTPIDREAGLSLAERANKRLREQGGLYSGRRFYDDRLYDSRPPEASEEELALIEALREQQRTIRAAQETEPDERERLRVARERMRFGPLSPLRERMQAGLPLDVGQDVRRAPPEEVQQPGLTPEQRERLGAMARGPLRAPAAPAAGLASLPTDPREEEALRFPEGRAAGAPGGGPAAGIAAALNAPQVQRPQLAPRPQSLEQGLGGLGQVATPANQPFTNALQQRVLGELGTDLEAAAESRRAKAAAAMGYTPEERKKLDSYIEELERMDRERFSPEAQRKRALEDFIAGAARSTSSIGSLGTGAAAVSAGERTMSEEMRKALQERLSKRETMIERDRALREKAFGAGEKGYEEASRRVGAAMQAGATLQNMEQSAVDAAAKRANDLAVAGINRDSAERVAQFQAEVQLEIAKATRDNTLEVKRQSLMQQIDRAEDRSLSDLYRSPEGQALTALLKQQGEPVGLNKTQKAELERLQGVMSGGEQRVRREAEIQRQSLMGTGGFSLQGVRKE
jgi:hypothetical protein